MLHTLVSFYDRDLLKLKEEILAYPSESALWVTGDGISNSGGNLCLHLCGNLQHFIGAALGQSGYVRQREMEFSSKGVPREALLTEIELTRKVVAQALGRLSLADMDKDFPLPKHDQRVSIGHMLLHLFGHLGYHLGQINYHRRMAGSI